MSSRSARPAAPADHTTGAADVTYAAVFARRRWWALVLEVPPAAFSPKAWVSKLGRVQGFKPGASGDDASDQIRAEVRWLLDQHDVILHASAAQMYFACMLDLEARLTAYLPRRPERVVVR